jgi:hypothetical protein
MNRATHMHGRSETRRVALGLLNTQNLLTVYWMLAHQPELLSKGDRRHVTRSREK